MDFFWIIAQGSPVVTPVPEASGGISVGWVVGAAVAVISVLATVVAALWRDTRTREGQLHTRMENLELYQRTELMDVIRQSNTLHERVATLLDALIRDQGGKSANPDRGG